MSSVNDIMVLGNDHSGDSYFFCLFVFLMYMNTHFAFDCMRQGAVLLLIVASTWRKGKTKEEAPSS